MQVGQRCPCRREVGIQRQRPVKVLGGTVEIRLRAALVDGLPLQVQGVGFGIGRARCARRPPFQQRHLQRRNDRTGDFVLYLEDVIQLPVIGLRPEVIAVVRPNQLRGNAQRLARLAHATFQHVRDAERSGDLGDR